MTQPQPPVEPDDDALRASGWTYRPYGGADLEPTADTAPPTVPPSVGGLADPAAGTQQFVLGLASLATGIPITAIAVESAGLPGLVIVWAGLVGINIAHGRARRRRG